MIFKESRPVHADDEQAALYAEQVRQLFFHGTMGLVATLSGSVVVAFLLFNIIPRPLLFSWIIATNLVVVIRYFIIIKYRRTDVATADAHRWEWLFNAGTALAGITWGLLVFLPFPAGSLPHKAFAGFVIGGMAIGAAITYSAVRRTSILFILTADIPVIVHFLSMHDDVQQAMGAMFVIFSFVMTVIASRIHTVHLTSLRLRFENNNLINYLTSAKDKAENLSHELSKEVEEHKRTAAELHLHRNNLQNLVDIRSAELTATNAQLHEEIKRRAQMEAELLKVQKLESLGILAGGIAHDFNNLLTVILGNLSVAIENVKSGMSMQMQLVEAENATLRARDLTKQLLTFSSGGAPVKKTASLGDLALETLNFTLRGTNVSFDLDIPDDLWPVEMDSGQMSQVIGNLVINATQAMPGGGMIHVTGANTIISATDSQPLPAGNYVKLSVADTGCGIRPEHLASIFDPYFTTKKTGTGLGLAISYSIIKNHGGHISVESTPGQGAVFKIYLPTSKNALPAAKPHKTASVTGGGKILLMEDDSDVAHIATRMLQQLGFEVECAADGREALTLYQGAMDSGNHFAAVIMDLTVPGGMGGKETIRELLKIDLKAKAFVSSGYSQDPVMAEYDKYGFVGVIAKPYSMDEMRQELAKVFS